MKSYSIRLKPHSIASVVLSAVMIVLLVAAAHAEAPLKAKLAFSKSTFSLDDPAEQISATLTLENPDAVNPVFTQNNFSDLEFQLNLYFKGPGPDGQLIRAITDSDGTSGTPSVPSSTTW